MATSLTCSDCNASLPLLLGSRSAAVTCGKCGHVNRLDTPRKSPLLLDGAAPVPTHGAPPHVPQGRRR